MNKPASDRGQYAADPGHWTSMSDPVSISNLAIRGFLYVDGTISTAAGTNATLVGSVFARQWISGSANVTIYRDPAIADAIVMNYTSLERRFWREIPEATW